MKYNLRSICDLLVFKTPFEDKDFFENRIKKITEMIEDYNKNSWLNLPKWIVTNDNYEIINYEDSEVWIRVQISIKKNYDSDDYFPILMINYYLNTEKFEKQNIEFYINDNIKLVSNVFFDEFFIDYDKNYSVNDINKWKKLDYEKLKEFDTKDVESKQNKDLLDSIMYIYFTLVKNIFDIQNSAAEISRLASDKVFAEFKANTALFNKIWFETKRNLIDTADKVKKQIDTFLKLIF